MKAVVSRWGDSMKSFCVGQTLVKDNHRFSVGFPSGENEIKGRIIQEMRVTKLVFR